MSFSFQQSVGFYHRTCRLAGIRSYLPQGLECES